MPVIIGNTTVNTSIASSNVTVNVPQGYAEFNATRNPIMPTLRLDFVNSNVLDPRITFTRSSSATYFNKFGTLTTVSNNTPRFDYNPNTLTCNGLLIEQQSTNILLNSASLSTQSVTVSATTYTLSFYGTGTVTLSGTYSRSLVGSGAFPTRSTLTFTATAGTLTLTVTGTVSYAQLEALPFSTSYIPTAGSTSTRTLDSVTITGTNFTPWYNSNQGTIVTITDVPEASPSGTNHGVFRFDTGTNGGTGAGGGFSTDGIFEYVYSGTSSLYYQVASTTSSPVYLTSSGTSTTPGVFYIGAISYNSSGYNIAINGSSVGGPYTLTAAPNTISRLVLGDAWGNGNWMLNGHLQKLVYYPVAVSNTQLISMTS